MNEKLHHLICVKQKADLKEANEKNVQEEQQAQIITVDEEIEKMLDTTELVNDIWQIEVPAIHLIAPIAEGTTQEVMREYVGHFEETSLWKGNIGLAAHNRRVFN